MKLSHCLLQVNSKASVSRYNLDGENILNSFMCCPLIFTIRNILISNISTIVGSDISTLLSRILPSLSKKKIRVFSNFKNSYALFTYLIEFIVVLFFLSYVYILFVILSISLVFMFDACSNVIRIIK